MSIYNKSWEMSGKKLYLLNKDEFLTPLLKLIKKIKESGLSNVFYARTSHYCLIVNKDSEYKTNSNYISIRSSENGLSIKHFLYSKLSKDHEVVQICKDVSVDEAYGYLNSDEFKI